MTNFEKWKSYFKHIHAPAQFIEAGFYFAISAAMERRVWLSSGSHKIFANQYVLLVGPAGVGKGLVTGVVDQVLRENVRADNKDETIVRMGPSSGSYQKLVLRMAQKSAIARYTEDGKDIAYPYASLCCVLDEFTSFFTEHAAEAVTFFCSAWAGNIPYDRDTHSKGQIVVKNPSLSMIAGTTPGNFQKLNKHDIIGTGLDRRLLVVFAESNEWRQMEIPDPTEEQKQHLDDIVKHIFMLTTLCGRLTYSDEARERLADWWSHPDKCTASNHYMLRDYHPNKNSLLHKLCIARHMAEGQPAARMKQPITVEVADDAIRMLMSYERLRPCAWSETGSNLTYPTAMRINRWLHDYGAATRNRILDQFFAEANEQDIDNILRYLITSGRVVLDVEDNPLQPKYKAVKTK